MPSTLDDPSAPVELSDPYPRETVAALAKVIAALPAIGKDAEFRSSSANYTYRSIESVTAAVRGLLGGNGLALIPSVDLVSVDPAVGMRDGWYDYRVVVNWRIVGPDGWIAARTIGIGRDNSDKGVNKAMTQAQKYLLLNLFTVGEARADADGIDVDRHRVTDQSSSLTLVTFEALKKAGPAHGDALRGWAEQQGKKLTFAALRDDPEWCATVAQHLAELAPGEDPVGEAPDDAS
jgi:hypothetical protein